MGSVMVKCEVLAEKSYHWPYRISWFCERLIYT